jgi:hypothetical protein
MLQNGPKKGIVSSVNNGKHIKKTAEYSNFNPRLPVILSLILLDFIKKLNIPNNAFTKEFQITEKNMDLYL